MAKADLRKPEIEEWRRMVGRAVDRARSMRGWLVKELADACHRDEGQIRKWISGAERAQFDVLFSCDKDYCSNLIVALAEMAQGDVAITTQITVIRRTA